MKEFGYFKITSYFYLIAILLGLVIDKGLIYQATFFFVSFILFFILQMIFYSDKKIQVKSYEKMIPVSLKDIFFISVYFLAANLIVQLAIFIVTYQIAKEKVFSFSGINEIAIMFFCFFIILFISNYLYYHLFYKKNLDDEEIFTNKETQNNHITTNNQEIIMTTVSEKDKEEN